MKAKQYLILILVLITSACSQPKQLVYQNVQNFKLKQAGLKQTEVSLDVHLFNPNNYGMKLKDADIDIFVNGNRLGKMEVNDRIAVPGLDTFSMPVMLNVDLQNAVPNILQLILQPEVMIRLAGTVKAGRHGVFVKIPVSYEGKQDIRSGIKF